MKRFYEDVAVVENDACFAVTLDGRAMRTPGKVPLDLPSRKLAEAIACEWRAQGDKIDPHAMPLTRFANTATDRVAALRDAVAGEIAGCARTDLLCHRVATPEDLAARQDALWQPILDWAAERHGATLLVTRDIVAVAQPEPALSALRAAVDAHGDFALSALHSLTATCGSVVLALAVSSGRISACQAAEASLLEEAYQAEQWGDDPEAVERRDGIRAEIASAARFLDCLTTQH
jgi:chaperone required for assembly of F1-ATPase